MSAGVTEQRAALLRRVDLLAGLDRVALARLVAHIEPRVVSAGDVICLQGDPADAMFIIDRGRFAVFARDAEGSEQRINTLEEGSFFGETALLVDETRSATVRADTDGEVLRLDRATFLALLDEHADAAKAVAAHLAHRLRHRDMPATMEHERSWLVDRTLEKAQETSDRGGRASKVIGVLLALGATAAAFFVVDLAQWRFVLFLVAAIALWVTEPVPPHLVSLGLVVAWVLTQIVPPYNAMLGFASTSWLFVFSVLGIASIVSRSGLLVRIGLSLIERVPASVRWQSAAFIATGILLTPVLPLAMARAAVMAPLSAAVADALRLRDREGASAVLGLSAWVGAGPFIFLFENGSPVCILAWSLMPIPAQFQMTWLFWFVAALPLALLIAAGMLVAMLLLFRPRPVARPSREPILLQRAVLGPLSRNEKLVGAVVGLTLAAWIVGPFFVLDPGIIGLCSFLALSFLTRSKARDLASLDWGYLVFFGVALATANITTGLRLDRAMGEALAPRLVELGVTGVPYLVLVAVATIALRTLLQADQAILLLSLGFIPVATALNVHPWLVAVTILAFGLVWHVPAETPEYLVARVASEGRLFTDAQARRAAFAYMGVAMVALLICMAYWSAIGLM